MIKQIALQYGSAGIEIHPVNDEDGSYVLADINPEKVMSDEKAQEFAEKLIKAYNRGD